jgi:hypothetical protein
MSRPDNSSDAGRSGGDGRAEPPAVTRSAYFGASMARTASETRSPVLTPARGLVRKTVDVVNYPDGRFAIQFEGISLLYRKFHLSGGQEERVATVGGRTGGGWQLGSSPRVG